MYHEGVDFTGRKGTPIISLIANEVVAWGWYGGYGQTIFMRNSNGVGLYLLGHLSEYPEDIAKGKNIFQAIQLLILEEVVEIKI